MELLATRVTRADSDFFSRERKPFITLQGGAFPVRNRALCCSLKQQTLVKVVNVTLEYVFDPTTCVCG